jgi:hypothetical protein
MIPAAGQGAEGINSQQATLNKLRHGGWSNPMKHLKIMWNPSTGEWFCANCGRTSDHANVHDPHKELDQYECQVPSVENPRAAPGTETTRLIRKPFELTPRTERSGCRFVVAKTDEGKP